MRSCRGVLLILYCTALAACASRSTATAPSGTGESAPAQARLAPRNLEELMQKIGPGYESMRKNLQGNTTAEAAKDAQALAEWFGGVEKFWAQQNREDAVKWAGQARTYASEAAGAAATGNPPRPRPPPATWAPRASNATAPTVSQMDRGATGSNPNSQSPTPK